MGTRASVLSAAGAPAPIFRIRRFYIQEWARKQGGGPREARGRRIEGAKYGGALEGNSSRKQKREEDIDSGGDGIQAAAKLAWSEERRGSSRVRHTCKAYTLGMHKTHIEGIHIRHT